MTDTTSPLEAWRFRSFTEGSPKHLSPSTRQILEEYSNIPSSEVLTHVTAVRSQAWSHHPYTCISSYRFLDLSLGSHTLYPEILSRLRDSPAEIFLDLGCAFGQDLRRLRFDGIPGCQLYGADLRLEFLDLGYELFRDRAKLGATFILADIFSELASTDLEKLEGRVDVIHAASFFHSFTYAEQKVIAHRTLQLLRPVAGSLVVGRQMGVVEAGERARIFGEGTRFRHSVESWRGMWEEVGREAGGVEFEVEGVLREREDEGPSVGVGAWMMMEFSVRRL